MLSRARSAAGLRAPSASPPAHHLAQPVASMPADRAGRLHDGRPHGTLVLVLAALIVVQVCGGLARLATNGSMPASATSFASSYGREPVVWDNDALTPIVASPEEAAPPALPSRVVMPTIGVDAAVGKTGIGQDGGLEVPDDFDNAFWFEGSAVPGDPGVSVLVGHIDDESGPAVFYRLELLKPGQEILVHRSDGAIAGYTVTELKIFPKGRFPTERVFGTESGPGLRLVTCIGRFDRKRKTYLDNLVVFAAPRDLVAPISAADTVLAASRA